MREKEEKEVEKIRFQFRRRFAGSQVFYNEMDSWERRK